MGLDFQELRLPYQLLKVSWTTWSVWGEGEGTSLPELGGRGLQVLGLCHLKLRCGRTLGTQMPGVAAEVCAQDPAF